MQVCQGFHMQIQHLHAQHRPFKAVQQFWSASDEGYAPSLFVMFYSCIRGILTSLGCHLVS